MLHFFVFMIIFHSIQFWLWRVYLRQEPSAYYRPIPTEFESMMFWPQFLGILKGSKPK